MPRRDSFQFRLNVKSRYSTSVFLTSWMCRLESSIRPFALSDPRSKLIRTTSKNKILILSKATTKTLSSTAIYFLCNHFSQYNSSTSVMDSFRLLKDFVRNMHYRVVDRTRDERPDTRRLGEQQPRQPFHRLFRAHETVPPVRSTCGGEP